MCPPCAAGGGATAAATQGPAAAPTAVSTTTPAKPSGGATPTGSAAGRLVVWDGDKVGGGQSWGDCAKKDQKCKSALTTTPGVGANGTAGLTWHVEGPDWKGSGWNWMGWWPKDSGTNIAGYTNLTFQIKVAAKSADLAPDPGALGVFLRCGNTKIKACNTATATVAKYVADFADGQWHKAVIPLEDLVQGDGAQFDKATAWELDFTEWSEPPRNFTVYVDDIAFEK
jgi:hypothetical protein